MTARRSGCDTVTRLWAAFTSGQGRAQGKGVMEHVATWGGWALDTVQKILRDHYLSLLDEGAMESAGLLATRASAQGFEVEAAWNKARLKWDVRLHQSRNLEARSDDDTVAAGL